MDNYKYFYTLISEPDFSQKRKTQVIKGGFYRCEQNASSQIFHKIMNLLNKCQSYFFYLNNSSRAAFSNFFVQIKISGSQFQGMKPFLFRTSNQRAFTIFFTESPMLIIQFDAVVATDTFCTLIGDNNHASTSL